MAIYHLRDRYMREWYDKLIMWWIEKVKEKMKCWLYKIDERPDFELYISISPQLKYLSFNCIIN